MKKIVVDAQTGIQTEVNLTEDEIAIEQAEQKEWADGKFERSLNSLRKIRNDMLSQSDWTDLPNSPLADEKKLEWQSYREDLRNITNGLNTIEKIETKMQVEDGILINFPVKPN